MKSNRISKRMSRAIACGLVGVLLLSVSVFAAYGSASGYGKYKESVTSLITDTKNATMKLSQTITYDGEVTYKNVSITKMDGTNGSTHTKEVSKDKSYNYENWYSSVNGQAIQFSAGDNYYNTWDGDYFANPFGESEYSDKIVKFTSLLADTVLGDLKNNFVLVNSEKGFHTYSLDLTADQMPALVNAGLDLMLVSAGTNTGYTIYEDSDSTLKDYYEKNHDEALPEDFFEKVNGSDAPGSYYDIYDDTWEEMNNYYDNLLEENYDGNGIMYVKADGTYEMFDDYSVYCRTHEMYGNSITDYLGANAIMSKATMNVTFDDNNRIVENDGTVYFEQTDKDGTKHTLEYTLRLDIADYGTTKVTPFDTGDRVNYDDVVNEVDCFNENESK